MKEKGAWQTKAYHCINSRVFFSQSRVYTNIFNTEKLTILITIKWYIDTVLFYSFLLNSIPFHADLTLEQNTFSVNPFSPTLFFFRLFLQFNWIRSVPTVRYSLSNMKLALLLVVFLAVILEVRSFGDQEQDSRQIPRKVGWVFYCSGIANRGKTENSLQRAKQSSNINSDAINKKITDWALLWSRKKVVFQTKHWKCVGHDLGGALSFFKCSQCVAIGKLRWKCKRHQNFEFERKKVEF